MREINVRELLRDLNVATGELPVTVTRWGKPIFVIISPDSVLKQELENGKFKYEV